MQEIDSLYSRDTSKRFDMDRKISISKGGGLQRITNAKIVDPASIQILDELRKKEEEEKLIQRQAMEKKRKLLQKRERKERKLNEELARIEKERNEYITEVFDKKMTGLKKKRLGFKETKDSEHKLIEKRNGKEGELNERKAGIEEAIEDLYLSDSDEAASSLSSEEDLILNEGVEGKNNEEKVWEKGIKTFRLIDGNFINLEILMKEEEKKKEKAKTEEQQKKLSQKINTIISRKNFIAAFSTQTNSKPMKALKIAFHFIFFSVLIITLVEYFLSINKFQNVQEFIGLILYSTHRINSILKSTISTQNLLFSNRFIHFLTY
jgi:hypothetical protein